MSLVTRWWWIRHAPSRAPAGRLNGRGDVAADLSDIETIARLAEALPGGAMWLVSPLRRAVETAEALLASGAAAGDALVLEPDFMEQDFGDWEGRAYDEIDSAFWRDPASNRPPGGESFVDVAARVAGAITRWGGQARGRDVVAVAHAGVVRAALAQARGCSPAEALGLAVDAPSLTRLDCDAGGAWRVVGANQMSGAHPN